MCALCFVSSDMSKAEVARTLLEGPAEGLQGLPSASGVYTLRRALSRVERLSSTQLAWALSGVLFVVSAWPLCLVEVPPYQDLPNHLAAVTVIQNPAQYPEFVFNGFFKTNAALFVWLHFVGKAVGLAMAARLFTALALAVNAVALPRVVLELTGNRAKMIVASLFAWPMVHNWFVSKGMLDFAVAVPLSLFVLAGLARLERAPSRKVAAFVALTAAVTWYTHVFPLLVVGMLVALHAAQRATWAARWLTVRRLSAPLVPALLLGAYSVREHMFEQAGPMTAWVDYHRLLPTWELLYNFWAEWFWGFTRLSATSLVPCVLLVFYGLTRRRESPPFFSPLSMLALAMLYMVLPYVVTNWFHVNSRLLPFICVALLLRVPERLPRAVSGVLALSAVLYSAGMGADFVRLERDRREFTAAMDHVPEGARLLPLVFSSKKTSENTASLLHAWGFYVVEKHASAPLLFAHSRSFPVMYREPPPPRFNHLVLEGFAPSMARPSTVCTSITRGNIVLDDCAEPFRAQWSHFWADAEPRFDHVLMWDATPEALALVPKTYELRFQNGSLALLVRRASSLTGQAAAH